MIASLPPLPAMPPAPFGLLFDVDGTLVDLASRPDAVHVPASLKTALGSLAELLDGAVALISGRSIDNLDRLFAPLRLRASGVHGAEWRADPAAGIETMEGALLPQTIMAAMRALAAAHPGTLLEDKRYSAALHYRAVPQAGPALAPALEALAEKVPGFRVLSGHRVYEIKREDIDKGVAVARLMAAAPFAGRRPVFIGDDVTDEPGMAAAVAFGGLACAVGSPRPGATHGIATPADVRAWVERLAHHR